MAEIRVGQICVRQIGIVQVLQRCTGEVRAAEISAAEVGGSKRKT
jgi:hypothetical protein